MKAWLSVAGLLLVGIAAWPLAAQPGYAQAASGRPSPAQFFADRLPRWFPTPNVPADNPITDEKVELGRHLFYEPMLSGNSTYSCATCHRQALAFTDGLAQAIGAEGGQHPRSSMSLANVVYNASFGWCRCTTSTPSRWD
jgi:cytochrome c peroxidase